MKKKYFLILIVLIFFVFLSSCMDSFDYEVGYTELKYKEYLRKVTNSERYMPSDIELLNIDSFSTSFSRHNMPLELFDVTYSVTLSCTYKDVDYYLTAKQEIEDKYKFLSETNEWLFDIKAFCSGYEIRVVDKISFEVIDDTYNYPHWFLMIGFNNELNKIIYMFHYDFEIDCIKDLDKFIEESYYLV